MLQQGRLGLHPQGGVAPLHSLQNFRCAVLARLKRNGLSECTPGCDRCAVEKGDRSFGQ